MNPSREIAASIFDGCKLGQSRQSEVDLRHCSHGAVGLNFHEKSGLEIRRLDELQERVARIGIGHDEAGGNVFSTLKHHTGSFTVLHQNLRHAGAGSNLRAGSRCGFGERPSQSAGSALYE